MEENDIMDDESVNLDLLDDIAFKYFFGREIVKNNLEYLVKTVLEYNNRNLKESLNIEENKT
ncbi:MAG: hypothetical protein LBT10_03610, partial [Methanobrevibacter sp.]|nr:hypothetical protein [Methanobrevibacter sp.]